MLVDQFEGGGAEPMRTLGSVTGWGGRSVVTESVVKVFAVCDGSPFRRFKGKGFVAAKVVAVGPSGLGLVNANKHKVV